MDVRRTLLAVSASALTLAAAAPAALAVGPPVRTYEVTIANSTTAGQYFTPAVVATHRRATAVFSAGSPASFEVKEIAENGNLDPLVELLDGDIHVSDTAVVPSQIPGAPPPIAPGTSVTFEITARPGATVLSWASMLICTNDGFTGLDSIRLPSRVGDTVSRDTVAYDAGTEINTEDWDDLVPPCAALTGFGDQGGTGMSSPDLAEGGVIAAHQGITGNGDLVPEVHGWQDPVATVVIERIG